MYVLYYIRTGYVEQVVVAFQHVADLGKALATEMSFLQTILLDHRSHAAVKHKYSVFDSLFQIHLFSFGGVFKNNNIANKAKPCFIQASAFISNLIFYKQQPFYKSISSLLYRKMYRVYLEPLHRPVHFSTVFLFF